MGKTKQPKPATKKIESYDIVDYTSLDMNTFKPKTVKTVLIAEDDVLYRKDNIFADGELRGFLMEIDNINPMTANIRDIVEILKRIEKKFVYRVHETKNTVQYDFELWFMLGNLTCQRREPFHKFTDVELKVRLSFESFKELLKAQIDKVGEKDDIKRKEGDYDIHNCILKNYGYIQDSKPVYKQNGFGSFYQSGAVAPYCGLGFEYSKPAPPPPPKSRKIGAETTKIIHKGVVTKIQKPNKVKEKPKPKRKYDLDSIKINDEIYKEVLKWIEDLKDYLHVDYDYCGNDVS